MQSNSTSPKQSLQSFDLGSFPSLSLTMVEGLFLRKIHLFRACDVYVAPTLAPKTSEICFDFWPSHFPTKFEGKLTWLILSRVVS